MAAKNWEADFRFPAIQASAKLVRNGYLDNPFDCPYSFCIPVTERPAAGWTPGKIMLNFLVLGFSLLLLGGLIVSIGRKPMGPNPTLTIIAVCCSFSGIALLLLPVKCDRWILKGLLGERGRLFCE